jgi:pimeloyl-ACP methyl ester carboxylesterase
MAKKPVYKSELGRKEIISFYKSVLKGWIKPHKEHHISTSYGNTFVIESGERKNPKLILLHGSSSNSAMWMADVKSYSKSHHVFAIDIIGECGNSSEERPRFEKSNYSNWLNEVFEELEINLASIVGCSLGGWIALEFSIQNPQKVNKLILIATAGITQLKTKTIFLILITSLFGKWGFKKLNELVYGNLDIDKSALDFAMLLKKFYNPRTDVLPIFSDSVLSRIKSPVLFIDRGNVDKGLLGGLRIEGFHGVEASPRIGIEPTSP